MGGPRVSVKSKCSAMRGQCCPPPHLKVRLHDCISRFQLSLISRPANPPGALYGSKKSDRNMEPAVAATAPPGVGVVVPPAAAETCARASSSRRAASAATMAGLAAAQALSRSATYGRAAICAAVGRALASCARATSTSVRKCVL